jgi:hypothetical protein
LREATAAVTADRYCWCAGWPHTSCGGNCLIDVEVKMPA